MEPTAILLLVFIWLVVGLFKVAARSPRSMLVFLAVLIVAIFWVSSSLYRIDRTVTAEQRAQHEINASLRPSEVAEDEFLCAIRRVLPWKENKDTRECYR